MVARWNDVIGKIEGIEKMEEGIADTLTTEYGNAGNQTTEYGTQQTEDEVKPGNH